MRSRALGVLQLGLNVGVCDVEILCRYFYLLFWGFSCLLSQSIDSCSESLRLESGFGPSPHLSTLYPSSDPVQTSPEKKLLQTGVITTFFYSFKHLKIPKNGPWLAGWALGRSTLVQGGTV